MSCQVGQIDQCLIWKGNQAVEHAKGSSIIEESPRAGGGYTITREAELRLEGGFVDNFR